METIQALDTDKDSSYNHLSDAQEKLLAILPIPSALLSICGCIVMIITVFRSRKHRRWTPYQGLMTSLCICNLISAITVASGGFLYPSDTSKQVWAFGNNTSCTVNGFFGQFATSALLYNGMLSYFFLLRLRFEHHITAITEKFEPMMHVVAVGYPLLTAFLGLFLDAYGERVGALGCAVRTCPIDPITGQREDCILHTVDLVFRRSIDFFVIGSMIVNTIIITTHLNTVIEKHTRLSSLNADLTKSAMTDEENASKEAIRHRIATVEKNAHHAKFKKHELLQVKLQGAFFIGSYVICNFATIVLQMFVAQKSKGSYEDEMDVPYTYFPFLILQSILFPLLGFLNCTAYMKPSLARTRSQHKHESMFWVFRRTVWGDSVAPTQSAVPCKTTSLSNGPKRSISRSLTGQPKHVSFHMQKDDSPKQEDDDISIRKAVEAEQLEGSRTIETSGSDQDTEEVDGR